jgi:hypothetical protein
MMTASQILAEVERRQIALVSAFGGVWMASVDECGDTITTKKRKIRSISATSSTPTGAVEALLAILNQQPQAQEFEDEFWATEPVDEYEAVPF